MTNLEQCFICSDVLQRVNLALLDLESNKLDAIISINNTPPASHWNSAPRGVTRFWGSKK
ncbi:hypothetical protein KUL150_28850 [Alteromonas sp. KUL150]|nr:hypothetical protein KUL150_28850 [Alteromonas sp. KUL150]